MLDICLKLLAIIGILLLILLGLFFAALFLVLFYPIAYRVRGRKDAESFELSVRVSWLAGFLRAQYRYPDPGRIKLKFLCFTLCDRKVPPPNGEDAGKKKKNGAEKIPAEKKAEDKNPGGTAGASGGEQSGSQQEEKSVEEGGGKMPEASGGIGGEDTPPVSDNGEEEKPGNFFEKIKKIKYTIQTIYDKIKRIWENISYYTELLQEEDTKELFAHALQVIGKILKSIRPRRVKADILFGTGSPDTTGYAYGAYCMLTASMKPGFLVTPDFEQKIFQGEFDLAGHVCTGVLLINGLKLLLDKKLHIFIGKIKRPSNLS